MPFYTHLAGQDPTLGRAFTEREEANTYADTFSPRLKITLIVTDKEIDTWTDRERNRFSSDEYSRLPWNCSYLHAFSCLSSPYMRESDGVPFGRHFAHMSRKYPGKVAYTPSEEYGVQDRQVVVKPGKYLAEFFPSMSREEIADHVAYVKAAFDAPKFATTADDIEHVYTSRGPSSCMAKSLSAFRTSVHPVRAYGDSDLAVAYTGDFETKIHARCVVWPEEKIYTRIYGDDSLRASLEALGYTHGTLSGARIRAIFKNGRYVCPYIDAAESFEVSTRAGKSVLILSDDDDGEYSPKGTDGFAIENTCYTCEHCGRGISEDEGEYCESCNEDQTHCERCGSGTFDTCDDNWQVVGDDWYCENCASRYERTCEVCDTTWFSHSHDSLCGDCDGEYAQCEECNEWISNDELEDGKCKDCQPEESDNEEDTSADVAMERIAREDYYATLPIPTPFVRLSYGDSDKLVECIYRRGLLAIHRSISHGSREAYTVTHIRTGLALTSLPDVATARELINRVRFINWDFSDALRVPSGVVTEALSVIRTFPERM